MVVAELVSRVLVSVVGEREDREGCDAGGPGLEVLARTAAYGRADV